MPPEGNRGPRNNTWRKFLTDSVENPPSCSEVLDFVEMKFKQAIEPALAQAVECFDRVDIRLGRLQTELGVQLDTQLERLKVGIEGLSARLARLEAQLDIDLASLDARFDAGLERFQAGLGSFAAELARLDAQLGEICWDATEDAGDYLSALFAFVSLDEHARREILGVIAGSARNNNHGAANETANEVRNEANNDAATTPAAADPGPSDEAEVQAHNQTAATSAANPGFTDDTQWAARQQARLQDAARHWLRQVIIEDRIQATANSGATNPGPSNDATRAALRNNLFMLSGWSHDVDYRRTLLSEDYLEASEALSNVENAEGTDSYVSSPPTAPSDEDDRDEDDNNEDDKDDKAKAKDENDDINLAEGTSIEVSLDVDLEADPFANFSGVVAHPEPANAAFEFDPEEIVAGTRGPTPTPPDQEVAEEVSEDGVGFVLVRSADDEDHDEEYFHIPSPTSSFDELESNASSNQ